MLGRSTRARLATAVVTPIALLVAALAASSIWPQTVDGRSSVSLSAVCALFTVAFATGPLAAFFFASRLSEPVAPRAAGAALGAAAGAWGALGIELYCVRATPSHVLTGHVVPVALLILVGTLVGEGVLRIRTIREGKG
jgi:hypothetical protein